MPSVKQNTLFGLRDLHVKLPGDPGTGWVQLVGAEDATYKASVSNVEQTGDDAILGEFYYAQKGTITAKASISTVAVLEKVSGVAARISQPGTGPNNSGSSVDVTDIQNIAELTPPFVSVRASTTARKADGTSGVTYMYFYKCLCKTVWESAAGGSYGKMTSPTLTIDTFTSTHDELNAALTNGNAFGRVEWA
jgi:hypothetical protein